MSRARNIKPGFFKNDRLAECRPLSRLLFAGLWCEADREGRLEDRPKRLKVEYLAYDECDCDELLNELAKAQFILRYQSGENRYISIVNFKKHQNPHIKEAASTIPAPGEHSAITVHVSEISEPRPEKTSASRADSPSLIPDSLTESPKTCAPTAAPPVAPGDGTKGAKTKPAAVPAKKSKRGGDATFEAFWIEYPVHRGKKTAREIWKRKNLDERIDDLVEDIVRRVKSDDQWKRGFIPHPSTYLRQERWEDELKARAAAASKPAHTPSPAVAEPKPPAMTDEQRLANKKRLDDLITKTLAGRLAS